VGDAISAAVSLALQRLAVQTLEVGFTGNQNHRSWPTTEEILVGCKNHLGGLNYLGTASITSIRDYFYSACNSRTS